MVYLLHRGQPVYCVCTCVCTDTPPRLNFSVSTLAHIVALDSSSAGDHNRVENGEIRSAQPGYLRARKHGPRSRR